MCQEVRPLSQLKGMGVSANIRRNGARVSAPCTVGVFLYPECVGESMISGALLFSPCLLLRNEQKPSPGHLMKRRGTLPRLHHDVRNPDSQQQMGGMVARGSGRNGERRTCYWLLRCSQKAMVSEPPTLMPIRAASSISSKHIALSRQWLRHRPNDFVIFTKEADLAVLLVNANINRFAFIPT